MFIFCTVIYFTIHLDIYQMMDDRKKENDCEISPF